ncbi:hypothetical protein J2Y45_003180 [Dyadobacter sp. BE34]|uniref:DUF2269 family protein n=1 Tax=Dyadobacter fermentans TaxID=94254 RepID=A0ABU1QY20_9BACT|nr:MULTISPECIES: DUF2214 family protein [Dyadobacter]MDR6805988.1 hypothetical protein [Dyadobacter fermentans]MDR7043728.1 hypothetical protein [Dyadobacter sp. BE242]MDR7198040.1 hypothetical protein [Dyadobacter sp. BE34]MDR7216002.1 hypothetical protein [Dyadobacter sp. BE31]MDR7264472.1 hypothetical protein [Dyadobacter sp. BE32]
MDIFTLRQLFLVFHLSGMVLMIGTTVAEFVVFRVFVKLLSSHDKAVAGMLKLMSGLGKLLPVGGVLLLISAIGLMAVTEGIYLSQLWLQVKLALILLLPVNGMLIGNREMKRLKSSLSIEGDGPDTATPSSIMKLNRFYLVQLLVFFSIIILAVFKFT